MGLTKPRIYAILGLDQHNERANTMDNKMKAFKFKQWTVTVNEADGKYNICNLGPDGKKQFYEIVVGEYGQPIIVAEPEYAFDTPPNLRYINAKGEHVRPDQMIAGVICQDGQRFSLTNAKNKGLEVKVNGDGSIQVNEEKWWLKTLFLKDKNRFRGYDAFCVREQPMGGVEVRILELGDLNLF